MANENAQLFTKLETRPVVAAIRHCSLCGCCQSLRLVVALDAAVSHFDWRRSPRRREEEDIYRRIPHVHTLSLDSLDSVSGDDRNAAEENKCSKTNEANGIRKHSVPSLGRPRALLSSRSQNFLTNHLSDLAINCWLVSTDCHRLLSLYNVVK